MPAQQNVSFYVFISFLLSAYSIYMLAMAIWGYKIIPASCDNSAIRSSLRGLMVTSAVALTAYIAYAACKYMCPSVARVKGVDVPNWLLAFTGLIAVVNLVNQITIQTKFGQDPNCQAQSLDTFKGWNQIGIIVSTCVVGLCIIVIIIRAGDARRLALRKKRNVLQGRDEVEEEEPEEEEEEAPPQVVARPKKKPTPPAKKPTPPAKKPAPKKVRVQPPDDDEDPFAAPLPQPQPQPQPDVWPYNSSEEEESDAENVRINQAALEEERRRQPSESVRRRAIL